MYVIRAQNDDNNKEGALVILMFKKKREGERERERLLTAKTSPNDGMRDNTDGLKLPGL